MDEEFRHRVLVAELEVVGQVVVGVDPGAGNDLEPGLLGHPARELDIATAEHRRRLRDCLHSALDHGPGAVDRHPELLAGGDRLGRLGLPDRAGVRPLGQHRLVAEDKVLVDEGLAELLGVDRAGDCLDHRHGAGTYPMRVPRTWAIAMIILILCLLASMVIALVRLI